MKPFDKHSVHYFIVDISPRAKWSRTYTCTLTAKNAYMYIIVSVY